MKFININGQKINIILKNYITNANKKSKSNFQNEIKLELIKKYPNDLIYEEVYVPGEKFVLDFFIPSVSLVIESHGIQHSKHIKFFHKTKKEFHQQQIRDQRKREWCEINGLKLIEIYK